MFLVLESRVHDDAQDLDMVFGFNGLSLDGEGPLVRFISLGSEVYNGCFVCFESRAAPFLPVKCFIDNSFNTFPVTLRTWSGYPRSKNIYERDRTSLAVDLSLYDVCVEEEE
ncbi:hypothetical protein CBS147353_11889 [Aspergillus niger]|nr:hypothetical protein CBS147353_11889 [Aspergillus niger]